MASFVWEREPQEAFDNPYEYEAQEQFASEAEEVLSALLKCAIENNGTFTVDERSAEKAVWMLLLDMIDALKEIGILLSEKRHRIAARLFRDVIESIDLAEMFIVGDEEDATKLKKWYSNEIISHGESRKFIAKSRGNTASEQRRSYYRQLSKFTHRSYGALLDSFVRGSEDRMFHDLHHDSTSLVLPNTISAYNAVYGDLILQGVSLMKQANFINSKNVAVAWETIVSRKSVARRFEMHHANNTMQQTAGAAAD